MYRSLLLVLAVCAAFPATLLSGGPNYANSGRPLAWDTDRNGPIIFRIDQGTIYQFDSATLYGVVLGAIRTWDTIPGTTIRIEIAGYYNRNISTISDPALSGPTAPTDGEVPVILDEDGSLTDLMIGAGAKNQVLGFASAISLDGIYLTDGQVVLNGANGNRNANGVQTTMSHELGHLLGLSHSQHTILGERPLLYPFSGEFGADDIAPFLALYANDSVRDARGAISGRVTGPAGEPISGVNVVAVHSETGDQYTTVTDYFSGNSFRIQGAKPPPTGVYRLEMLPPGEYHVKIEGILPGYKDGSLIGSYTTPMNHSVVGDWYNGAEESGAMLLDNLNLREAVPVAGGRDTPGVNIVMNDTTGVAPLRQYGNELDRHFRIPRTYQGVRTEAFATRFVAPYSGAPAALRILLGTSNLRSGSKLIVNVHASRSTADGDAPGTIVHSVEVPHEQLSSLCNNHIWLFDGPAIMSFRTGDVFYISLEVEGPGQLDLGFDGTNGEISTYYRDAASVWNRFPVVGNDGGQMVGELEMDLFFAATSPGISRGIIRSSPESLIIEETEVGSSRTAVVTLANVGTAPETITQIDIAGVNVSDFRLEGFLSLPLVLAPGEQVGLTIRFSPSAPGVKTASIRVNGVDVPAVNVTGVATASTLVPLLSEIDFGTRQPGERVVIDTLALAFSGEGVLAVRVNLDGDPAFDLVRPTGSTLFRNGDSLAVQIAFTPPSSGDYQGMMKISFSPARDTLVVNLRGRGDNIGAVCGRKDAEAAILILSAAPNPVTDILEVQVVHGDRITREVDVRVLDMAGRVHLSERRTLSSGPSEIRLDVRQLAAGPYLVVVDRSGMQASVPIVIVR